MRILDSVDNNQLNEETIAQFKEVDPATIGHHLHFGFMDPTIKSMLKDVKTVGKAFTVKTNVNDSTLVHKAVSLAKKNDVIVIDRTGDEKHACVGEIVAYAANSRNVAGIIIDGPCTDIQALKEIDLPIFSTGLSPITTKLYKGSGEINTVVQCGGVSVHPGDLIVADDNGVLVVPQNINYKEILEKARKSEEGEPNTKKKLDEGVPLSSLTKADQLIQEKTIK